MSEYGTAGELLSAARRLIEEGDTLRPLAASLDGMPGAHAVAQVAARLAEASAELLTVASITEALAALAEGVTSVSVLGKWESSDGKRVLYPVGIVAGTHAAMAGLAWHMTSTGAALTRGGAVVARLVEES